MAKGQRQAADANLAATNQVAGSELAGADQLQGELTPAYTSEMNTGYMSPQDKQAAQEQTMGAASEPFDAASFQAANRAAATNNPADLTAQQDQLALEKGTATGNAATQLQAQQQEGQLAGAQGLSQLSDEDMKAMEGLYGLGPATLGARAAGTSTLSQIGQLASGAGSLIGGIKE